jgi:hypothetical protein
MSHVNPKVTRTCSSKVDFRGSALDGVHSVLLSNCYCFRATPGPKMLDCTFAGTSLSIASRYAVGMTLVSYQNVRLAIAGYHYTLSVW